jgi:hypothetical protein
MDLPKGMTALPRYGNLHNQVQWMANQGAGWQNQGAAPAGYFGSQPSAGVAPSAVSPATYSSMFASNTFSDPNALASDYTQKYAEAKAANEGRYAQGMQGYGDLHNRAMGNLANLSNQNAADIRNTAADQTAANNQRMTSLGLSGTTVGSSLNNGVNREMNASLNRNNDEMIKMQNDTDASTTGAQLGFLERRSDPYPDMGAYASLMSSMGRAAAGTGGPVGGAGGGVGAGGGQMGVNGGNPYSNGSNILGDMSGNAQQVFTRSPSGQMSQVTRTPAEQQLAKNPMYLDSAPAGMFNQNAGQSGTNAGSSARWGAPAFNYSQMYGQGGIPGVSMMQRQMNGGF